MRVDALEVTQHIEMERACLYAFRSTFAQPRQMTVCTGELRGSELRIFLDSVRAILTLSLMKTLNASARTWEIGLRHSSCEAGEQSGAIRCGAGGAKGGDQGECGLAKHAQDFRAA